MIVGEIVPKCWNIDASFRKMVRLVSFMISDGISTANKSLCFIQYREPFSLTQFYTQLQFCESLISLIYQLLFPLGRMFEWHLCSLQTCL